MRAYTTSAGVPTPTAGSPFVGPNGSHIGGAIHPAGFYMVSDRDANRVSVLRISNSGAATTLTNVIGSPFSAGFGNGSAKLTSNSAATYLFALDNDSRNVTRFFVNSLTGALSSPLGTMTDLAGGAGRATGLVYIADGSILPPTPTPTPNPYRWSTAPHLP
ncbi:MAG: hypothetical protein WA771_13040 [Chthoniobacterales bacterium]